MEETEGKGKTNGMGRFLNCKVKVVYDDGSHITIKFGTLIDYSEDFLFLSTSEGEQTINKNKIIRVERCY